MADTFTDRAGDIDLNVAPQLVAMYEETGRLEALLAISDQQIEDAAKGCMRYVQNAQWRSGDDSIWCYIDGWNPFEVEIRKALGREKKSQRRQEEGVGIS